MKEREPKLPVKLGTRRPDLASSRKVKKTRLFATATPDVRKKRAAMDLPESKSATKPNDAANQGKLEDAKVIVAIDFGTTYSGFAYAAKDDPDKVETYYDWPSQAQAGAKSYCKTPTSLWYVPGKSNDTFDLQAWGWPAQLKLLEAVKERNVTGRVRNNPSLGKKFVPLTDFGRFFTKFKLYLADNSVQSNYLSQCKLENLPKGLSAERMITDYLRELSIFIMSEVRNRFGSFILKKDIQWCLSVPTIWSDGAKKTMEVCSEKAGLVHGFHCRDEDASVHKIEMVLEAEAASVYCQQKLKDTHLSKGSKFLVVDAGGGTVDLVVHEKVDDSGLRVKEVTRSTGDLCGGTLVDTAFLNHLAGKIDCFRTFCQEYPSILLTIQSNWESFKYNFDGCQQDSYDLELPTKLSNAWVANQKSNGSWRKTYPYDALVITKEDMYMIFDGQVNKILKLIKDQLAQVPKIEAIMVVGGFSYSRYLMKRIRDTFLSSVRHVTSPMDPGSAICRGAVAFGAQGAEIMMSRKSRKTYGISMFRPLRKGDPPGSNISDSSGENLCKDAFCVFTRIGEDVPVNHCVQYNFVPFDKGEKCIRFTMYSTMDPEPAFVTDVGVDEVGSWTYPYPPHAKKLKEKPSIEVSMYFGRTHIDVSAKPKNFEGGKTSMFSVLFEKDLF